MRMKRRLNSDLPRQLGQNDICLDLVRAYRFLSVIVLFTMKLIVTID